jgi:hypothetical protein
MACGQAIEQVLQPMQYQMSEDSRASWMNPSCNKRIMPVGAVGHGIRNRTSTAAALTMKTTIDVGSGPFDNVLNDVALTIGRQPKSLIFILWPPVYQKAVIVKLM